MLKTAKILFGMIALLGLIGGAVLFTPLGDKPLAALFPVGDVPSINFQTLELKPTPNQYLLCPNNYCEAQPHGTSPEFQTSTLKLQILWETVLSSHPKVTRLPNNVDHDQASFIQRTHLLRFPDVITIRFIPLSGDRSTIALYSRSLYGGSDFGANKLRINQWLTEILTLLGQ